MIKGMCQPPEYLWILAIYNKIGVLYCGFSLFQRTKWVTNFCSALFSALQHSQCFIALSAPSFSLSHLFPVVAPPLSHCPMPAPKDEPDWDTAPSRHSPVPGAMAFREHPYKEAQVRFTTQVLSHRALQVQRWHLPGKSQHSGRGL